jgi:adenosyl cobinamide kinase/adenosyl cobinamide phosphate guanylyltransferase
MTASEVGAGPASPNATERQYRKAIGYTNRKIAEAAQTVVSCNAGILRVIKSKDTLVLR